MSAAKKKDKDTGLQFSTNATADFAYSLFRPLADSIARDKHELREDLKKSNFNQTAEQFISVFLLSFIICSTLVPIILFVLAYNGFVVFFYILPTILDILIILVGYETAKKPVTLLVFFFICCLPLAPLYFWGFFGLWDKVPNLAKRKARQRAKKINLYLPYAATYIASLAAANATLPVIFKSLASQKEKKKGIALKMAQWFEGDEEKEIYPEICKEAGSIYKDITLLGIDAVSALKNAVDRAPSPKLSEFLQGIFSTITSGGNLKKYFLNSAEHYMEDNKQQQKEVLNFVELMAETYVVAGIAMPIFLLIILIITQWISQGGGGEMDASIMYLIIFGLLPIIHLSFAGIIYGRTREK